MGLFDRWKKREEPKEEVPEDQTEQRAETDVEVTDSLLRALLGTGEATKEKAMEIPTMAGCISYIAGTISTIPIMLYKEERREDGSRTVSEVPDDPRVKILNDETGDTLDAVQFWYAFIRDYLLGKGGYAYIRKERNKIVGLHYVNEESVSIVKNADPIFKDYAIMVQGRTYRPYEFLKILRNTKDGCRGYGIVEENPMMINVGYNTLKFENTLIKKGGNKRGFLQAERELSQESINSLKEGWDNLYGDGEENVMILNKGIQFQEASSTSVELQLNENKITNAAEICKLTNVPEGIINGTATANDYTAGFKLAVMPILRVIECALNRDFLLEREKHGTTSYYWEFDKKEITKGDIKSRYEAYKIGLEANFIQVDEVRYMENLEPLGLEFIKLGLNDVLYWPETGKVYTPNTDKTMGNDFLRGGDNIED